MADTPHAVEHEHGPTRVSVDVADSDRFSVVVDRIRVTRTDGAATAPSAPNVVNALDYLGERLRAVETEPDEVLVRSASPVPAEGGKQYYELRFRGDGMTMERRQAGDGETASVPFVLPKATLDRLVDDLGHTVGVKPAVAPVSAPPPDIDGDLFAGHKGCC